MTSVLIGHTGFVGSNLARSHDFDLRVNSGSIGTLRGGTFGTIVCAGVSAVKWKANRDPEADAAGIARLTEVLETVRAAQMILISTVDVLRDPAGADEARPAGTEGLHPYGLHRLQLEGWMAERFPVTRVLRLPALFGPGLRKNILYDLQTGNMPGAINPASRFQWYPVTRLWQDIGTMIRADLDLLHLATEPVRTEAILRRFFPGAAVGTDPAPVAEYDFRTRHAEIFGATGPYMMRADAVMAALGAYLAAERAA